MKREEIEKLAFGFKRWNDDLGDVIAFAVQIHDAALKEATKEECLGCRHDLPTINRYNLVIHIDKQSNFEVCGAQSIRALKIGVEP